MYVAIEGIIGVGKTTFAKVLARELGWRLLEERVVGNQLLEEFYRDQRTWAFPLQIRFLLDRWRSQQVAALDFETSVTDRSPVGDRCFAKMHVRRGNIHPLLWDLYQDAYYAVLAVRPPLLMVFLDVDPEVALERVRRRERKMEVGIDLAYLRELRAEYEEVMREVESGRHCASWARGIDLMRVPWSDDDPDQSATMRLVGEVAARFKEAGRR